MPGSPAPCDRTSTASTVDRERKKKPHTHIHRYEPNYVRVDYVSVTSGMLALIAPINVIIREMEKESDENSL